MLYLSQNSIKRTPRRKKEIITAENENKRSKPKTDKTTSIQKANLVWGLYLAFYTIFYMMPFVAHARPNPIVSFRACTRLSTRSFI